MTSNLNMPADTGSRAERWRRHAFAFAFAAGAVLVAGSYVAFLAIPNEYRAEAVLTAPRPDTGGLAADASSSAVLEAAALQLGMASAKDSADVRAAAALDLRSRVDVKTRPAASGQAEVIVSAQGAGSPRTLANTVNAVAESWRARCLQRTDASAQKASAVEAEVTGLKQAVGEAGKSADNAHAALLDFESRHAAEKADAGSDPEGSLKSLSDERLRTAGEYDRVVAEVKGLEDAEKMLRDRLKEVPQTLTSQEVTTVRNPEAVRLEREIQQMQRQLDDMLKMYTFRHPEVIALQTDILQKKRQLEALDKRVDDSVKSSKTPNPEYATLKGKLDDTVVRLQVAKTSLGPLADRRKSASERFDRLEAYVAPHRKLVDRAAETAKLVTDKESLLSKRQQDLEASRAAVEPAPVLSRPAVAIEKPVGPSRGLFAIIAVAAALFAGVVSVSAAVRMSPGFAGPAEVRRFAGAPVLGAVAAAKETEGEASSRLKTRLYVVLTLATALAAVLAACAMAHYAGR